MIVILGKLHVWPSRRDVRRVEVCGADRVARLLLFNLISLQIVDIVKDRLGSGLFVFAHNLFSLELQLTVAFARLATLLGGTLAASDHHLVVYLVNEVNLALVLDGKCQWLTVDETRPGPCSSSFNLPLLAALPTIGRAGPAELRLGCSFGL